MATGSSSPYWWRSACATSRGTFGLAASSSNGSPGARARIVKRTRLMPARTGTMISSRRMKYLVTYRAGGLDMAPRPPIVRRAPAKPWRSSGLTFAVPVLEVPEVRVPAALLGALEPVRDARHCRPQHDGDHDDVLDGQVVHLDEQRRPLDRIQLALRRAEELVVLLVAPARDVPPLSLVVLGADAVAALLPAGRLEDLVGLVDVELVLRVPRVEPLRLVEEVGSGDACAPVDLLLHGGAIDEEVERLPDGGIGEERVLRLEAGALAVDVFPRIGVVELDVLDVAARCDVGLAPAALLHALEVLVLDLQVPGEVVLAGLDDGAGGRVGVAAALHLDGVEVRAVGHVIGRVQFALDEVARLEVGEPVGPGAHRLQVGRRLPRLRALEALEEVLGEDHPAHAD